MLMFFDFGYCLRNSRVSMCVDVFVFYTTIFDYSFSWAPSKYPQRMNGGGWCIINKIETISAVARNEADEKLRRDPENYTRPDIMLNDNMLAEFDVCK